MKAYQKIIVILITAVFVCCGCGGQLKIESGGMMLEGDPFLADWTVYVCSGGKIERTRSWVMVHSMLPIRFFVTIGGISAWKIPLSSWTDTQTTAARFHDERSLIPEFQEWGIYLYFSWIIKELLLYYINIEMLFLADNYENSIIYFWLLNSFR